MGASVNPLFGRAFELVLKVPNSDGTKSIIDITSDSFQQEPLRITFEVKLAWWTRMWTAVINIYNLNEQTANLILSSNQNSTPASFFSQTQATIEQGTEVTLAAGYQNGRYGVIWDGFVLQPLFERENQTDFKITLNCVIGLDELNRSPVNVSYGIALTQQQLVEKMAAACYHPLQINKISNSLAKKSLPRGKVFFGNPKKFLMEMSRDNNAQAWLEGKGLLNIGNLNTDIPDSPVVPASLTFCPANTQSSIGAYPSILGTPVQTQLGVDLRLMLDPTVTITNPPMVIRIDNTQIRQLLKQVNSYPTVLSQDGTYVVVGVTYRGDTRGNDWYTDVTGWLTANEKLAALGAATGVYLGGG